MSTPQLNFSTVLASSIHDMKNSVTMLLLNVQELLVQTTAENAAQQSQLSKLEYEASRINNDLVQLLALYRLDEKTLSANIDESSVLDMIREQLIRNESLFSYKAISINLDCHEDLCWFLDAELLGSVINNLLVNAARYAKSRVRISVEQIDGYLQIVIEDDGNGFPAQMLDENHANEYGDNRLVSSTQLGLLFAKRILALHSAGEKQGYLCLSNKGIQAGARVELFIP
jgi:signal transduction histidine kinase